MKKMSEVFELPIKHENLEYLIDRTTYQDDAAIIHAINHVDALYDALHSLVFIINEKDLGGIGLKAYMDAQEALAAYRGEK